MPKMLSGNCLCESVRFEVEDSFRYSLICHCSQCRRATGAANKPFGGIETEKLRIAQGQADLLRYGDGKAHDVRCGTCGSFLYSVVRNGKFVHVALGSLSQAPSLAPSAHIYVGSKASWEFIADGLPQHDEV